MSNYIPINLTYYNPATSIFKAGKSDRERYTLYTCCNTEHCDAYKQGKCLMLNGIYGQYCPYGSKQKEVGYTKAARKCGELVNKAKERYSNVAYAMKELNSLCNIGDCVYLNLPWLSNYENPIRRKEFFVSESLIRKEDFTPKFIVELIKYKPKALSGGEIKDYQKEKVPTFVRQLRQTMLKMYVEIQKIYPEIDHIGVLEGMNFVGKKALVKTLKAGKVQFSTHIVDWDGTNITFKGKELLFSEFKDEDVIIIPNDKTYVKVVDNNTVTENTVFIDE